LLTNAPENVRGGLEAIEELSGGFWTDAGGANGIEDLAECDLELVCEEGREEETFAVLLLLGDADGVFEAEG